MTGVHRLLEGAIILGNWETVDWSQLMYLNKTVESKGRLHVNVMHFYVGRKAEPVTNQFLFMAKPIMETLLKGLKLCNFKINQIMRGFRQYCSLGFFICQFIVPSPEGHNGSEFHPWPQQSCTSFQTFWHLYRFRSS